MVVHTQEVTIFITSCLIVCHYLQIKNHIIIVLKWTVKIIGMSSIWRDRFTVKLMISMSNRYANMLNRCEEDYTRSRNTLFFPARSFLKNLLMAFICVYFDQLYSQISPQSKISIANINKIWCLLSGIHLGDNFRHAREMCAQDTNWLCP